MTITKIPWEGVELNYMEWDEWVPPGPPVTGPPMTHADNTTQAFHYTAAINLIDGDPGEDWNKLPQYIRNIHLDYLTHRPSYDVFGNMVSPGYAIGYNHGIDARGWIWKLRGWDIACAANRGWNPWTYATLCFVDGASAMTPEALRAARYLHWKGEQLAKRELFQRPHSQLRSDGTLAPWPGNVTGCCGDGIRGQIAVGKTNWRYTDTIPPSPLPNPEPVPEPTPTPDQEEDMFTCVMQGETPQYHPVLLTLCGSDVGMTGLTDPDDLQVMLKRCGQTTPLKVSDGLWVDFYNKAVISLTKSGTTTKVTVEP